MKALTDMPSRGWHTRMRARYGFCGFDPTTRLTPVDGYGAPGLLFLRAFQQLHNVRDRVQDSPLLMSDAPPDSGRYQVSEPTSLKLTTK